MSTYELSAVVKADLYREAKESRIVMHKPDPAWVDPDATILRSMEEYDALCIGQSSRGETLYHGYTVYQVWEMSSWSLSDSDRHWIAKYAKDADSYLLGVIRYIRHKVAQAVRDASNPFGLLKAVLGDYFGPQQSLPPTLLVMPKRKRGRPQTEEHKRESLMLEVYFFRYLFLPYYIMPFMVEYAADHFARAGLQLKSPREVSPLSFEVVAAIMNIDRNTETDPDRYQSLKRKGVEDALTPDSYRKLCREAEKEVRKDPNWFQNTRLRHIQKLGFATPEAYTEATGQPHVIDLNRDRHHKILDVLADAAGKWAVKRAKQGKTPELIH